jgi:hypothetical protein
MAEQPPLRRARTAKWLSGRYDLNYFKGGTGFSRWRLGFCLILAVVALVWLGGELAAKRQTIYSAGSVSAAHSFFGSRCEVCHTTMIKGVRQVGGFSQTASDEACLSCHQAPDHHSQGTQPQSPSCSSCHVEHQGPVRLAHVQDAQCLSCHSDLKEQKRDTLIAAHVRGFEGSQHPEFAPVLKRLDTPPAIIFHHVAHMGKSLKTLNQDLVALQCADCHRPLAAAGHSDWKYRQIDLPSETTPAPDASHRVRPDSRRELMTMPSYTQQCAGCHDLKFDSLVADSLKHPESQKDVLALPGILQQKFQDYIRRHPEALRETPQTRIPEQNSTPAPRDPDTWVQLRVARAEHFLGQNTCKYCHQLEPMSGAAGLPRVKESGFKPRQMVNAVFSHEAHISVTCESCHVFSHSDNLQVTEKLLPGIATCQACHNGTPAQEGKAENGCFLCHQYHKWDPQREMFPSKYTIEQLTGTSRAADKQTEKPAGEK